MTATGPAAEMRRVLKAENKLGFVGLTLLLTGLFHGGYHWAMHEPKPPQQNQETVVVNEAEALAQTYGTSFRATVDGEYRSAMDKIRVAAAIGTSELQLVSSTCMNQADEKFSDALVDRLEEAGFDADRRHTAVVDCLIFIDLAELED